MDPISIAAAVTSMSKVALNASSTLYMFVNEVKSVDQNIKSLANEVQALSNVLREIQKGLADPTIQAIEKNRSADDRQRIWRTVAGALEECRATITRIDTLLNGLRKNRYNWATQAFRQVKFNLRKEEIDFLRAQTHTHCSALNMTLQMVNMYAHQTLVNYSLTSDQTGYLFRSTAYHFRPRP